VASQGSPGHTANDARDNDRPFPVRRATLNRCHCRNLPAPATAHDGAPLPTALLRGHRLPQTPVCPAILVRHDNGTRRRAPL